MKLNALPELKNRPRASAAERGASACCAGMSPMSRGRKSSGMGRFLGRRETLKRADARREDRADVPVVASKAMTVWLSPRNDRLYRRTEVFPGFAHFVMALPGRAIELHSSLLPMARPGGAMTVWIRNLVHRAQ